MAEIVTVLAFMLYLCTYTDSFRATRTPLWAERCLGSAPARLPRLLRARLAAVGTGPPRREAGPPGAPPHGLGCRAAAPKVVDLDHPL